MKLSNTNKAKREKALVLWCVIANWGHNPKEGVKVDDMIVDDAMLDRAALALRKEICLFPELPPKVFELLWFDKDYPVEKLAYVNSKVRKVKAKKKQGGVLSGTHTKTTHWTRLAQPPVLCKLLVCRPVRTSHAL